MKQALFLIVAIAVMFTACRKKADRRSCYECYRYDSVSAKPADPKLFINKHVVDSTSHCNYTEDLKNLLISRATIVDTYYHSEGYDTIQLNHWTMRCEIY